MKKISAIAILCICMIGLLCSCKKVEHVNGSFNLSNLSTTNEAYSTISAVDFVYNTITFDEGKVHLKYLIKEKNELALEKKVDIIGKVDEYGEFIVIKGIDIVKDVKIDQNKMMVYLNLQLADGVMAECIYVATLS